ncbi:hypothetical protein Tco_1451312, partial [Tanacetum coccineum]
VMGEPLSPDRVFDFPMDEPHPTYDYFAPAPLPGYAGNLSNKNGWLVADDYLLRELEAMMDEQMVVPTVDEIVEQIDVHAVEEVAEPVVKAEEEQVIAPVADVVEGQMDAPMMDMEEDLAVMFGDDDFEDDASDGFGEDEVALGLHVPPCMIKDLSTRLDNLEYGHGQLVQRVIQGSDVEITASVIIGEIGRVGSAEFYLERRDGYRIDSAGSGLAGRCAVERHADPAAVDYCYRDEQQGEHADAVHFGIGETDCSLREKTTRTPVVLFVFHFDF